KPRVRDRRPDEGWGGSQPGAAPAEASGLDLHGLDLRRRHRPRPLGGYPPGPGAGGPDPIAEEPQWQFLNRSGAWSGMLAAASPWPGSSVGSWRRWVPRPPSPPGWWGWPDTG